jgi:glutamate N-acetyltransferase / amino-acid N-acetyltransferase
VSFFSSRWVDAPAHVSETNGLAAGFRAAGVACGIKSGGAPDLGLLVSDEPATASAARFTRSGVLAAPVLLTQERTRLDALRAIVANAGNANAATGRRGLEDAARMQGGAAMAMRVPEDQVAVASTGVIGVPLDMEAIRGGIGTAAKALSPSGGVDFAAAICTTDRWPKRCTVRAGGVTLSAQAKGAGMMEPGFATLLCFAQTDAEVAEPEAALRAATAASFERVTVDGQMSTNDTVIIQATGAASRPLPEGLLDAVLLQLALEVVADGEGATRLGRVQVQEAASAEEADRVARAIANSPLVQTALFGRDPNWGRIAQAAGMALAGEELRELGPAEIDAEELAGEEPEAELAVRLGRGDAAAHIYFSDLTYDYVKLNAEYTT